MNEKFREIFDTELEAALAEMQAPYVLRLQELPLPTVQLPFCFAARFGLSEVERFADGFATTLGEQGKEKTKRGKGRKRPRSSQRKS